MPASWNTLRQFVTGRKDHPSRPDDNAFRRNGAYAACVRNYTVNRFRGEDSCTALDGGSQEANGKAARVSCEIPKAQQRGTTPDAIPGQHVRGRQVSDLEPCTASSMSLPSQRGSIESIASEVE